MVINLDSGRIIDNIIGTGQGHDLRTGIDDRVQSNHGTAYSHWVSLSVSVSDVGPVTVSLSVLTLTLVTVVSSDIDMW